MRRLFARMRAVVRHVLGIGSATSSVSGIRRLAVVIEVEAVGLLDRVELAAEQRRRLADRRRGGLLVELVGASPLTATASSTCGAEPSAGPPFLRRRLRALRALGKLRSRSRASALGLRAMRVRAPRSASSASGVWASAAASSAALRRRSCLRAAWISRRALRACAAAATS